MRWGLVGLVVVGCAPSELPDESARELTRQPPEDTVPCESPEYWPRSIASDLVPVRVHYAKRSEATMAREVMRVVEQSWKIEFEELGFRAPLPDDGACGPDERLDVFLWRGHEECYVDPIDDGVPATPWPDRRVYVVVDPWGPYGGDILASTVAHELNHAGQSADDWDDLAIAYEMTANFVQKLVIPDDTDFATHFRDFQDRPDWSVDRDDGYETWFSYGASLYLFYLRETFFPDDPAFIGRTWEALRRRPHFEAALADVGVDFLATMPEFARWRWHTAERGFGEPPRSTRVEGPGRLPLDPKPMVLGSAYFELPAAQTLRVTLEGSADVRWLVQMVDGRQLEAGAVVTGGTLVVTALPTGAYDPRRRHDRRYAATLVLTQTTR